VPSSPSLIRVVFPVKLQKELTYGVPEGLARFVQPGVRVIAPLRRRTCAGYIVGVGGEYDGPVKPILDVADPSPAVTPDVLELCQWMSDYYAAPLGEVLLYATAMEIVRYRITSAGQEQAPPGGRLSEILSHLTRRPRSPESVAKLAGREMVHAALLELVERGFAEAILPKLRRRPEEPAPAATLPPLTAEQRVAAGTIVDSLGRYSPIVLHGVTASGKTRVYMEAILAAHARGESSLYLVPEIAMTILLEREFSGVLPFCTIHSQLSPSAKARRFAEIRTGRHPLVIGTRSALFAPLPNLGLIVVDEEHDSSYKQDERVRYSGRDAAVVRAKQRNIPIVLGSATPSLETYQNGATGKYTIVSMRSRLADRSLPASRIVNMRSQAREGIISEELKRAMEERLAKGEQVILLLNRRGYSPFLVCNTCGSVLRCRDCQVSMVFHKEMDIFLCHYCGARQKQPELCPECRGSGLFLLGEGTERAVDIVRTMLAGYRVERLDSDVAVNPELTRRLLSEFSSGAIHVLVGTQMLAKGHHFPNVTLVGVLSIDHLLGFPDFRASERVFQLVTQVSGRSGRGDRPGEVIIQTRYPSHASLVCGSHQDYDEFFQREIHYREALRYPPFTSLILVTCRDEDRVRAARRARTLADLFRKHCRGNVDVTGPVFAPLPKIRKKWRVNTLLRGDRKAMRETLRAALAFCEAHRVALGDFTIDVDPLDVM